MHIDSPFLRACSTLSTAACIPFNKNGSGMVESVGARNSILSSTVSIPLPTNILAITGSTPRDVESSPTLASSAVLIPHFFCIRLGILFILLRKKIPRPAGDTFSKLVSIYCDFAGDRYVNALTLLIRAKLFLCRRRALALLFHHTLYLRGCRTI